MGVCSSGVLNGIIIYHSNVIPNNRGIITPNHTANTNVLIT